MKREWYRDAFSITHPLWYLPLDATAVSEVEQVLRLLPLPLGAPVLDLCCGHGRHAVELARRGYRVTGLDLSPERLAMARERAARAGVELALVEADMRQIPRAGFTAVLVLYESFGFLDTDAEHLQALQAVRAALAPGGHLLLQVDNRDQVLTQPSRQWGEYEGLVWWADNRFEPLTSRNHLRYTGLHRPSGESFEQSLHYRLFSLHELKALVEAAGLELLACWGSLAGEPVVWNTSPSLVLHARRPAAD